MAQKDPSRFEYTLKDMAVTAVSKAGARFDFSDRVGGSTNSPNGTSTVGKGSATYPVYHTGTTYEPSFAVTVPIDEKDRFRKWFEANCAADGVCDIERRRKKARVAAVVDKFEDWLPIDGDEEFAEGDEVLVEITGNYLLPRRDITNSLSV